VGGLWEMQAEGDQVRGLERRAYWAMQRLRGLYRCDRRANATLVGGAEAWLRGRETERCGAMAGSSRKTDAT